MTELIGKGSAASLGEIQTGLEPTTPLKDEVARLEKPFLLFDRHKTLYDSEDGSGLYSSRIVLVDPKTKLRLSFTAEAAQNLDNEEPNPLTQSNIRIVLVADNLDKQPLPALTAILGRLQFQTRLLREKGFSKPVAIEPDADAEGVLKFVFDIEGVNRGQLYTLRGLFSIR